jgi:uncharacterized protein (DUF427 family)
MGLMTGTGPLAKKPAGMFNFDPPEPGQALYIEPCEKWIRVVLEGETIADSRRTLMVSESGHQPVYYFPPEDVRSDLFEPSDRHTRCPKKGEASYHSIRVGERFEKAIAWYYPEPLERAEPIKDLIAFYFDRMDHWYEEDEEIFGHPRDPYHRVDVIPASGRVRISLEGETLAESERAMALFESNLPVRWYLPREDVDAELVPSDTVTVCPYKGRASYYSIPAAGETGTDLVWYYEQPFAEATRIAGLVCFYNERVDVEVDGELRERPEAQRGHGAKPRNAAPAITRG